MAHMFTNISVVNFNGRRVGHCIYTGDYNSDPMILSEIYSYFSIGEGQIII